MIDVVGQEHLSFGTEAVTLVGDPRRCVGLLRVHNPHKVAVKLRRIRLRTSARELRNVCDQPDEDGAVEVQLSAALCAGETQQLRIKLRLPPGTPPGTYEACVEGKDGSSTPVAIHVLEQRKTRLSPTAITCATRPGQTFTLRVSVLNLGNVAVVIPARAAVELHASERGWPDHFHAAARSHGDQGYAAFLDAFVKKMAAEEPPIGRAKLLAGAGPLAPLAGRLLEIEVSLPKKLHANFRYRALVRLADALLHMTLHMNAADETTSAFG